MRMSPQFIMLVIFGISGSVLYAAEEYRQWQETRAAARELAAENVLAMSPQAEVDKDKKVTDAAAEAAKTDAAKTEAAKKAEADKASKDSPATQAADAATKDAAADKGAATAQTGKSGKTDADRAASPQRFVPSEEVRADFDVSFPVDI